MEQIENENSSKRKSNKKEKEENFDENAENGEESGILSNSVTMNEFLAEEEEKK